MNLYEMSKIDSELTEKIYDMYCVVRDELRNIENLIDNRSTQYLIKFHDNFSLLYGFILTSVQSGTGGKQSKLRNFAGNLFRF
jgi:hypothetical protein